MDIPDRTLFHRSVQFGKNHREPKYNAPPLIFQRIVRIRSPSLKLLFVFSLLLYRTNVENVEKFNGSVETKKKTQADVQILLISVPFQCADSTYVERKREKKRLKNSKFREAKEIHVCIRVTREKNTWRKKKQMRNSVGGWGARMGRIYGEAIGLLYLGIPRFIVNTNELQVDRARALIEKVGRRLVCFHGMKVADHQPLVVKFLPLLLLLLLLRD